MRKKVLIATNVHDVLVQFLTQAGYECIQDTGIDYTKALKEIGAYEGVITSNKLPINRELINNGNKLKWIGRMGSGMEIIDVPYAATKNIRCFSSPEGNANAVAEQALGMLLSLQHRIFSAAVEVKQGIWQREENRGVEIEGLTAGIIGYGNNGRAFAKKLTAMGVKVIAYDKYIDRIDNEEPEIPLCESLEDLFPACDILSFHVPLNDETYHYFDDEFLQKMQRPFVLLNLSRGEVVATGSLYSGIKWGKIKAAAIDVWEQEPIAKMEGDMKQMTEELLAMDNFIGTPHIGGYSVQAIYKMSYFLGEKIKAFLHSTHNQNLV